MAEQSQEKAPYDAKAMWTEEKKAALAQTMKEYWVTHPHPLKGKQMTQEAKDKVRDALKQHYETHPGPMTGKHHTEETKAKLRATMLARYGKTPPQA
jgi:hypothetical protein